MMLDGLLRRAPPVKNATTAESLGYFSTGPGVLEPVGETNAMKLSTVNACIEILSNSMSKLPAYFLNGSTRERVSHPLSHILSVRPNEAMAPSVRKKMLEANRLSRGNAYDWIVRDPRSGRPRELIPVPADLVLPWRDTFGHVWYTVLHPLTGEPMKLPGEDICHYKAYSRDGLKGISVLERAADVIASGRAAQTYDLSFYSNGAQPGGVLTVEGDLGGQTEIELADGTKQKISIKDSLRREWESVHAGPKKGHRTAILDFGVKYSPVAVTNKDAQFIERQDVSVQDIARFFLVPLYKLQAGKQAYGSNEQNAIEYVVSALHPIVTQYEEELTWKLLTDSEIASDLQIRINMMAELRGDSNSRGTWYDTMSNISVYSPNDIRALEDMPDVLGGNERRASLNYIPLSIWEELSRLRAEKGMTTK